MSGAERRTAGGRRASRADRRRRILLGLLAVVALLALSGCSGYAPQLCTVCEGIDRGAAESDLDVRSVTSSVVVDVGRDGDATVTVRIEFAGDDVDQLRSESGLRRRVLEAATGHDASPLAVPEDADHRMAGDELVVAYDVADVADRRSGGVLVVDRFYDRSDGSGTSIDTGTTRFVLRGPEGSTVARSMPGATAEGNELVWAGSPDGVSTRHYAAFDLDGSSNPVETELAIGAQVAEWAAPSVATFALLAGLPLAVLVEVLLVATLDGRRSVVASVREAVGDGDRRGNDGGPGSARRTETGTDPGGSGPGGSEPAGVAPGDPGAGDPGRQPGGRRERTTGGGDAYPMDLLALPAAGRVRYALGVGVVLLGALALVAWDPGRSRDVFLLTVAVPVVPVALFAVLGVLSVLAPRLAGPTAVLAVGSGVVAGLTIALGLGPGTAERLAVYWATVVGVVGVVLWAAAYWIADRASG